MNWLKKLFCKCPQTTTRSRRILVDVKKNHVPEILWEVKKFCRDCERLVSQGYFTEDQVGNV